MENKSDKKNNLVGILGLLVAIVTLLFGDNLYERLTGNSFLNNSIIAPTSTVVISPTFDYYTPYAPTAIPTSESANFLSSINAKVISLTFFESGIEEYPPVNERVYSTRFNQETTRFVNWQLDLEHPSPEKRIDFVIHAIYYKSNGSIFAENDNKTYILTGWDNITHHSLGSGWENAGNWTRDTYTVVLYIDKTEIARESFTIE